MHMQGGRRMRERANAASRQAGITDSRATTILSVGACALFTVLILSGCTVGPKYVRPDTTVPEAWNNEPREGPTAEETDPRALAVWWGTLNDATLTGLIERAVVGNLDLMEAKARVREARARRSIQKSGLFPSLEAAGSAQARRSSEETGGGKTSELYAVGFDAAWEVDVFGGLRRGVEAADADLEATNDDLRDTLVTLVAEVALNYIETRTFQARLSVAEANLEAQAQTHQLTEWRFQAGLSDELAVQQARYNMENTRSQMPALRSSLEESKNRLAVLLGEQPGAVHAELEETRPIPVPPPEIAVGVPADLLRRRPDVHRAERELAAQTARIGEATADLYPKFSLLGSIGLESLSMGSLFAAGSRTYNVGPTITWPIFRAGAIRQNIEVESALQEQALHRYEEAVLTALEEVENALVAFAEEQNRRQSLDRATEAAERAVKISQHQYEAGQTDFNSVLISQRSLLSLQDQLTESEGAVTGNLVRLYKALGGGWSSSASDGQKSG